MQHGSFSTCLPLMQVSQTCTTAQPRKTSQSTTHMAKSTQKVTTQNITKVSTFFFENVIKLIKDWLIFSNNSPPQGTEN